MMGIMTECEYFAEYGEHDGYDKDNTGVYRCLECGVTCSTADDRSVHYGISCVAKDVSNVVTKLREMGFNCIRCRPDRLANISAEYDLGDKDLARRSGLRSSVLAINGVIAVVDG